MRHRQTGAALMEFALAWPVVLLVVLGAVQLTVWATETMAARSAALAGARAGSVLGATPADAGAVAQRILAAVLIGVEAEAWCPGSQVPAPQVWVCARDVGREVDVEISGSSPSLVPAMLGVELPLHAHVVLEKVVFAP